MGQKVKKFDGGGSIFDEMNYIGDPFAQSYSFNMGDSGAPSLTTDYDDLVSALGMGDTSQAAFEQAAQADLLNQLAATDQTDEEVLASVVGAAPSGTPLGRLSDEDLLERYKSAVASLRYVQQQPRTLPGTGTYTKEGQDYLDEVFGDISDAKKEVDKYIDEINARGLDFPKEDTPYGGKVGTVIGPQGATTTVVLGDEAPNIPGTDTGIYTGSYNIPGGIIVDTGVSTGVPVLDDIIKAGAGQEVGGKVTITDIVLEETARRTGIPVDDILDALEDSGIFGPPAPSGTQTQTPTQTQTGGAATQTGGTEEDTEGAGPFSAPVTATAGGLGGLADIFGKIKDLFDGDTDEGDATTDTGATTRTTTDTGATTRTTTDTGATTTDATPTSDTPEDIVAGGGDGGGEPSDIVAGGGDGGGGEPSDIVAGGGDGGGEPSDIVAGGGGDGSTIETGSTIQTGGGGGGGGFTLPQTYNVIRETPGDVVDIKYLYDFAKGLDQPFQATNQDEDKDNLYMYAEGGEVANEDAVDMLTKPRRPGEYGRRYFTDGQFVPTGTALGGAALDPGQIQIPQYTYQRELLPQFGGPAAGVTTQPTMPMGTNVYTPPNLPYTFGQEDYTEGLATDSSTQAAVNEALAGTTTTQAVNEALAGTTTTQAATDADAGTTTTRRRRSQIREAIESDPARQTYAEAYTPRATTGETSDLSGLEIYQTVPSNQTPLFSDPYNDIAEIINYMESTDGISTGEAGRVLNYAINNDIPLTDIVEITQGINPDFTIEDAVTYLETYYPHHSYNYLKSQGYAAGGNVGTQGYYLGGPTDGMADQIPATIDGRQPAALSDGEFVIPADVVSHLGNGNSQAGAQQLYSMMDRVRTERTGTTKQGPEIDPTKMMPA